MELREEILRLKREKNAIILAHYYQNEEIQAVADFLGDSFALSQKAAENDADVIVFCGVHFMAEVAAILSPEKKVVLPELSAGCPLADFITVEALQKKKKEHPNACVVSYVNSTAAIKAESYTCCTSANAVKIAEKVPFEEIIMVPDGNLARWVQKKTKKKIIPWEGCCPVHDCISLAQLKETKSQYPDEPVLVHPECQPAVADAADFVGSTSKILEYVRNSSQKSFIIGTEEGILYTLKKENPNKVFHMLSADFVCPDMKKISMEKLAQSLRTLEPRITVDLQTATKAELALRRMLDLS